MTRLARALLLILLGCLAACGTQYRLVESGATEVSGLQLYTRDRWNLAPAHLSPMSRSDSVTWTRDGLLLDRLLIIPAVPHGATLFEQDSASQALPLFRRDMGPKDIEELVESSLTKLFGEGQVLVDTGALRPQRFGETGGFPFDLEMAVTDGPDYRGISGAFVRQAHLYLVIYLAADPYYFDKHRAEALAVIRSARL